MRDTGRDMMTKYKETSRGGLAVNVIECWGMPYFLGIDTGGTYTDAVLLDQDKRVVAAAKSLTTRFDLAVGISASLDRSPKPQNPEKMKIFIYKLFLYVMHY